MEMATSVEEYFEKNPKWEKELENLRNVLLRTEFIETLKWGIPTYTINKKNVVSIAAFKNYVGLWFTNGSFLKDDYQQLINANEGKTKGMRQWRFTSVEEIDERLILEYSYEAIQNQKEGKEIKIQRNKPLIIPIELEIVLGENSKLKILFEGFTKSKQREFAEHISSAKRETTRLKRLEKIIPMILSGVGLNDKYRNC
jgi:uncharacterized protein YdeI (YjbR/CyaY-like superfamily)